MVRYYKKTKTFKNKFDDTLKFSMLSSNRQNCQNCQKCTKNTQKFVIYLRLSHNYKFYKQ